MNDAKTIAASMAARYRDSAYTAYERAIDHAFSHDRNSDGFRYWQAVADELEKVSREQLAA